MKIFNLDADEWDRAEEREGWRFKDAWVGAHTDAELIGASMYEVEPGNKQGPFHTHHANEEWAIVLRGEPTLRTHEGEQQLRQGDVVACPRRQGRAREDKRHGPGAAILKGRAERNVDAYAWDQPGDALLAVRRAAPDLSLAREDVPILVDRPEVAGAANHPRRHGRV